MVLAVLSIASVCGQTTKFYSIAKSVIDTTEKYLYNPAILKTKEWIDFKTKVLDQSVNFSDDIEFKKMFNSNAAALPFTHYGIHLISRNNMPDQGTQNKNGKQEKFKIRQIDNETVLFTVKTFSASKDEIIPFIDSLKTMNFSNLIIDLRNNSGGTIASALPLAEYLVRDTLYGGAFLTQKYFIKNTELPTTDEYKKFPLFSEASFSMIINGIHNQEGLCLVVYPDENAFEGKLYVLVNRNTASTCEPLIYGLKSAKRATLVGERSYGAMLNGEEFNINDEFSLFMPTADYYTADGQKIDKAGVEPDIAVDPADALEKTMEIIRDKSVQ